MTMHIALNHQQQLIHISDAIRGLACECTCFCCHEPVLAKKGPTNEHHFAHISLKESCQINPESVLHAFAKEVILDTKGMMMPALPNQEHSNATWWDFDEVQSELKLGLIRPDIVAYCKEELILIEMAVTHFVDEKKQAILNSLQLKTLEVDLSELLQLGVFIPSEEAKQWILDTMNGKRWLFPQAFICKDEADTPIKSLICQQHWQNGEAITEPSNATAWQDYQFTIDGVYVRAREFSGGMVILPLLMDRISRIKQSSVVVYRRWLDETYTAM